MREFEPLSCRFSFVGVPSEDRDTTFSVEDPQHTSEFHAAQNTRTYPYSDDLPVHQYILSVINCREQINEVDEKQKIYQKIV